jgi:hypothetical protein
MVIVARLAKQFGFSATLTVIVPLFFPDSSLSVHQSLVSAFSTTAVHEPLLFTVIVYVPASAVAVIGVSSTVKNGSGVFLQVEKTVAKPSKTAVSVVFFKIVFMVVSFGFAKIRIFFDLAFIVLIFLQKKL